MNGGILPMALLCAAVGLALGPASLRSAWVGFASLSLTALLVALMPLPGTLGPAIFLGLWLSVIATAALVYLPCTLAGAGAVAVGVNGGLWVGALAGVSGMRNDFSLALPLGLSFLFRRWLEERGYVIAIKVVASWVIAIAALVMFVSLTPTPGYAPDHME